MICFCVWVETVLYLVCLYLVKIIHQTDFSYSPFRFFQPSKSFERTTKIENMVVYTEQRTSIMVFLLFDEINQDLTKGRFKQLAAVCADSTVSF